MDSLTLEQKVGQIFLARCPETGAAEAVRQYHLGGFVLFDRDFEGETPSSMAQKIAGYQGVSDIPLLIAVDEEGGTVNRVSGHKAFRAYPFPSPRALYTKGGLELIHNTEAEKAQLLSGLGQGVACGHRLRFPIGCFLPGCRFIRGGGRCSVLYRQNQQRRHGAHSRHRCRP